MSFLSGAHNEWHLVNGHNTVCPLDCGAGEPDPWDYMTDEELAEYDRWAEEEAAKRDPWIDTDFLPGGPDFDPPF